MILPRSPAFFPPSFPPPPSSLSKNRSEHRHIEKRNVLTCGRACAAVCDYYAEKFGKDMAGTRGWATSLIEQLNGNWKIDYPKILNVRLVFRVLCLGYRLPEISECEPGML